jgi:hypothetical protein
MKIVGFVKKFTERPRLECCIAFGEVAKKGPRGGWKRLGYNILKACFREDYPEAFEHWKEEFPCVRDGKCVWTDFDVALYGRKTQ